MPDRQANPNHVINTILRRIRFYLDEPVDDKYTDNDLLDLCIPPALQEVWGYLHATSDNPIIASFVVSVTSDTKEYKLPPSVQNVWRVAELDEQGNIIGELRPLGKEHRRGPTWYLEADKLRFDPAPTGDRDYTVFYTPTPDQPMHYAEDGTLFADLLTIQLSSSPTYGFVDIRDKGYIGCVIRMLSGDAIETRIIDSHDPSTDPPSSSSMSSDPTDGNIITVRDAFTRTTAGTVSYEIFPPGSAAFTEAVALGAVLKLGAARNISQARMTQLMMQYRHSRKAEVQRLENMLARRGKHIQKVTVDNPDLGLHNLFTSWWTP